MKKYLLISIPIFVSMCFALAGFSKSQKEKKMNVRMPFVRDAKMGVAKDKMPPRVQSFGDTTFYENASEMLEKSDLLGYGVYLKTKQEFFRRWLEPDDSIYGLTTAIHESVHGISGSRSEVRNPYPEDWSNYYFYLPDGTYKKVNGGKKFFNRDQIARYLKGDERDGYYEAYLTGDCGQQDLPVLLDEVNAYTFDVYCGINYVNYQKDKWISTRDGIATFMYYLELYIYHARTAEPAAYDRLKKDPEYLTIIKTLWENAEDSLWKSANFEQLGINDKPKLQKVLSKKYLDEVAMLFDGTGQSVKFNPGLLKRLGYN